MRKLAIFVEGQTEQIFVENLLREIVEKNHISIEVKKISGRKKHRVSNPIVKDQVTIETRFYVLIYDSSGDTQVVSDIRDQCESLSSNGYERIIGLRDVYCKSIADKTSLDEYIAYKLSLERGLHYSLSTVIMTDPIPMNIVLAVMEIESWFLSEWNHFPKIDAKLTLDKIQTDLGFNPKTDNMETRLHPSSDIDKIYRLVGSSYDKNKDQINSIVSKLDYEFLYLKLIHTVPSLGKFIGYINLFLN